MDGGVVEKAFEASGGAGDGRGEGEQARAMGAVGFLRSDGMGQRAGMVGGRREGAVVIVFALAFGLIGFPGGGEDLKLGFDGAHADKGEGLALAGGEHLLDGAHVAGDGLAVEVELLGDGGVRSAGAEEVPDAVAQGHGGGDHRLVAARGAIGGRGGLVAVAFEAEKLASGHATERHRMRGWSIEPGGEGLEHGWSPFRGGG